MKMHWYGWGALTAVVCALAMAGPAYGNVYPAGLKITDADITGNCEALQLTYFLNEDADGDGTNPGVKIEVLNQLGTVVRTVNLERQKKGKHIFVWDGRDNSGNRVANTDDSDEFYRVRITAADFGYSAWIQISSDANRALQFEQPRGLAVNRNPDSPYYGRLYVSQTRTAATATGRTTQDGLYMVNPDQSNAHAAGQEDISRTGGINWTLDTGYSGPFKSEVGPDNNLYIADWSDQHGGLYVGDPELNTISELLQGQGDTVNPTVHGSIPTSPLISGTLAGGDLTVYTIDEDMPASVGGGSGNDFWFYNIGSGPLPWNTAPASRHLNDTTQGTSDCCTDSWLFLNVGVLADAERGPDGKFYLSQRRSDGNQVGVLVAVEQDDGLGGKEVRAVWDSLTATRTLSGNPAAADTLRETYAVKVSPDGTKLAVINIYGTAHILPLVGGIPDLGSATVLSVFPTTAGGGRDVAWDAAGNLYVCSNIQEVVRVWSPPTGIHTNQTTSGTFLLNKGGSGGPAITAQPASVAVCPAQNAVFNATATGTNLTYQWKRNGVDIAGQSGAATSGVAVSLTLSAVTAADDGAVITVEFCSTDNGVIESNPALLSVGASFILPPLSQSICVATGTATFTARARGVGTLNYQWKRGGADLPGQSGTVTSGQLISLTLNGLTGADDNALISLAITDSCGTITSPNATLRVRSGPAIAGLCCSRTVNPGESATFSVTASGTGTLSYVWKKTVGGNTVVVGGNSSFLSLTNIPYSDNGALIFVEVTDQCGTTVSGTVTITVNPPTSEAGFCDNGIDDDNDGATDCLDPDCATDPACACIHDPFADHDDDGDVDQLDFADWQLCFTGSGDPLGLYDENLCSCYDRNFDSFIDTLDFPAFSNCFSGPMVPADPACDDLP